jgi:hypothetical protein
MENNYGLIKAFGPSIYKARIPEELLSKLNNFIDATINDEEEVILLLNGFIKILEIKFQNLD